MNIYQSESEMRQAHPYLANHLTTIATYQDGLYTAQTADKIYQWREA